MAQFSVHDSKTRLSCLIADALACDEIVITRGNVPVVRLVPVVPQGRACLVPSGAKSPAMRLTSLCRSTSLPVGTSIETATRHPRVDLMAGGRRHAGPSGARGHHV